MNPYAFISSFNPKTAMLIEEPGLDEGQIPIGKCLCSHLNQRIARRAYDAIAIQGGLNATSSWILPNPVSVELQEQVSLFIHQSS